MKRKLTLFFNSRDQSADDKEIPRATASSLHACVEPAVFAQESNACRGQHLFSVCMYVETSSLHCVCGAAFAQESNACRGQHLYSVCRNAQEAQNDTQDTFFCTSWDEPILFRRFYHTLPLTLRFLVPRTFIFPYFCCWSPATLDILYLPFRRQCSLQYDLKHFGA